MGLVLGAILTSILAQGLNSIPTVPETKVEITDDTFWVSVEKGGAVYVDTLWETALPEQTDSFDKMIDRKFRAARLLQTSA